MFFLTAVINHNCMYTETQSSAQRISVNILHERDYTANTHVEGRQVLKLLIQNV